MIAQYTSTSIWTEWPTFDVCPKIIQSIYRLSCELIDLFIFCVFILFLNGAKHSTYIWIVWNYVGNETWLGNLWIDHGNSPWQSFEFFSSICVLFNWKFTGGRKCIETKKLNSFEWEDAKNNCIVNEDIPKSKKGEANEETQGTTFQKTTIVVYPP